MTDPSGLEGAARTVLAQWALWAAKMLVLPALTGICLTLYQNQLQLVRVDQRLLGVEQNLARVELKLDHIVQRAALSGSKGDLLDTASR